MEANHQMPAPAEAMGFSRASERPGRSPTALVVKGAERTLCRSASGRSQAGHEKPLGMAEALASHAAEAAERMRGHCCAPGRRKWRALEAGVPHACQVVLAARTQGFDHDEAARTAPLSPAARGASPQASRRPLMAGLTGGLTQPCEERRVEPNSAVGKALASRPGHGETLRRLFSVLGAPLDPPLGERAGQLCIRQRHTARCYKTEPSAASASGLTSVLAPCRQAGGNALA
jgi:hypothetical protein